jgi:hypothetical protein
MPNSIPVEPEDSIYESPERSARVRDVGTAQQPGRHPDFDRESGPKGSDRVGTAGKGNPRGGTGKAPRKSDTKESDRVGNTKYRREAPGGKPERVSTKEASVP